MIRRAIVGINNVARGAAAAAIIAGLIVCAGKIEKWIEQARLLQTKEDGIGAKFGAKAAVAEFVVGPPGFLFAIWVPDFALFFAAALEYAQHVAGLRNFPALERSEFGQDAFRPRFFWRGTWDRVNVLRDAIGGIAFAEAGIF